MPPPPAPPKPARIDFIPASFADLPGWEAERFQDVLPAFQRSCAKLSAKPEWLGVCRAAAGASGNPKAFFETHFKPWRVQDNGTVDGLFTGYYEAEFKASRTRKQANQVPLLGLPPDLGYGNPLFTITPTDSAYSGRGLPATMALTRGVINSYS